MNQRQHQPSTADLSALLDLTRADNMDHAATDPLPLSVLTGLAEVIGADMVSYDSHDPWRVHQYTDFSYPSDDSDNPDWDDLSARFWELYWTFEAFSHASRTRDFVSVTKMSDFHSTAEVRQHPMGEVLAHDGITATMELPLGEHPRGEHHLLFYRVGGSDFTDRERLLLGLMRPHLRDLVRPLAPTEAGTEVLTPRQRELLTLVAEGHSNAGIARRLCLSEGTVRKHLENIYSRLGVNNRTAAVTALNSLNG